MYKIVKKQELTTNIYLMDVEAKRVAKSCMPGQFVIVRMDDEGERIPLTIHRNDDFYLYLWRGGWLLCV